MSEISAKPNRRPIRLHPALFDVIDSEAAYRGEKAGTVANRILAEELERVEAVGIEHCVVRDSRRYNDIPESERVGEGWYVLPTKAEIAKHLPSRGIGSISKQVSFYFSDKNLAVLEKIVRMQNIVKTMDSEGEILTIRFAVVGLMLNNKLLSEVDEL